MSKKRGGFLDFVNGVLDVLDPGFSDDERYYRDEKYLQNTSYYKDRCYQDEFFQDAYLAPKNRSTPVYTKRDVEVKIPLDLYIFGGNISSLQIDKFLKVMISNANMDCFNVFVNANAAFKQSQTFKVTKTNQLKIYDSLKVGFKKDDRSAGVVSLSDIIFNISNVIKDIQISEEMKNEYKPKDSYYYPVYEPKEESKLLQKNKEPLLKDKSIEEKKPVSDIKKEEVQTKIVNQYEDSKQIEFSTPFEAYLGAINDTDNKNNVIKISPNPTINRPQSQETKISSNSSFADTAKIDKKASIDTKKVDVEKPTVQKVQRYCRPNYNYIIDLKNINIVSNFTNSLVEDKEFLLLQKEISSLRKKGVSIVLYPFDEQNIELISGIGFNKVEMLYDEF